MIFNYSIYQNFPNSVYIFDLDNPSFPEIIFFCLQLQIIIYYEKNFQIKLFEEI